MTLPAFNNIDDVVQIALRTIKSIGHTVRPRGIVTQEVLGFGFVLDNPRARKTCNPERRWSLPLAIGEFCWHSAGSDSVEQIAYYAPAWRNSSDDGERIVSSCYGRRIFGRAQSVPSQWDRVKALLSADPDSRRAVLQIHTNDELNLVSARDVACTLSCQFLNRGGRLHAFVSMRSNDAILGLPYDVFLFTMLQERLAHELGLELGGYTHVAASMHLYERHFELAEKVLAAPPFERVVMPMMRDLGQLPTFLRNESEIRTTGTLPKRKRLSGYWGDLERVLLGHAAKRQGREVPVESAMLANLKLIA